MKTFSELEVNDKIYKTDLRRSGNIKTLIVTQIHVCESDESITLCLSDFSTLSIRENVINSYTISDGSGTVFYSSDLELQYKAVTERIYDQAEQQIIRITEQELKMLNQLEDSYDSIK